MKKCKIKSVKFLGKQKTYNLTMNSEQHNYAIYDINTKYNIFSKNSHSCCYAFNSYLTAYFKANYTDEFLCALLTTEAERGHYEKIEKFEKDFKQNLDVKFLPRDINTSKLEYRIKIKKDESKNILKSEIYPNILSKGVGYKSAKDIVDNQPFKDLKDFAKRTDTSIVDLRTVEALLEGGYINGKKGRKNKEAYIKKFEQYRKDMKALQKRGVESVDIFS